MNKHYQEYFLREIEIRKEVVEERLKVSELKDDTFWRTAMELRLEDLTYLYNTFKRLMEEDNKNDRT